MPCSAVISVAAKLLGFHPEDLLYSIVSLRSLVLADALQIETCCQGMELEVRIAGQRVSFVL
jgi:hypothetical protein